jgi:hypothetical protein
VGLLVANMADLVDSCIVYGYVMYKSLLFFFVILAQYFSVNRTSLLYNIFYAYFQAVLSFYCLRLLFQLSLHILVGLGKCSPFFLYLSVSMHS